jgi:hypothetical protein
MYAPLFDRCGSAVEHRMQRGQKVASLSVGVQFAGRHGWLRCAASCVAEFQGECAEEEGADGPEGDDAEALPGGERQGVHPGRGLGV